ncbi:unnamed protein product [Peniophora sp. CBMAI 1063]|nr:unnamed protein product [Peniophora sp. CBMAI 1063]
MTRADLQHAEDRTSPSCAPMTECMWRWLTTRYICPIVGQGFPAATPTLAWLSDTNDNVSVRHLDITPPLNDSSVCDQYKSSQLVHSSHMADLRVVSSQHTFPLLLETALLAVFTVQTVYFVCHRCLSSDTNRDQPSHRHTTQHRLRVDSLVGLALCLYLLLLAYWAIDVAILHQELSILIRSESSPLSDVDVYAPIERVRTMEKYIQATLQVMIWIAGDSVALWRAYVVLGKGYRMKVLTASLLFIDFGAYVSHLVYYTSPSQDPPLFMGRLWERVSGPISVVPYMTAASATAFVQLATTSLISYKAWLVWTSRKGLFCGPGRVFRTLAAVIESGLLYTLLWIWYIIGSNDRVTGPTAAAWVDYYMLPVTAMFPTLVVMVVALQDSVLEGDGHSQ